ncbi:Uncharacterized protein Rs2_11720 [Raphanus sativus]|nr:Uncharacterized protein Rs2_11720 [Raphanus sativus]
MARARLTQRYAAANVGVFWDINDFPIPDYLDSYAFYEDVKTNLREKGFTGSFSLQLYADGDPYMPARLVNRFQCPELGVSYIPSGGEFCRDSWILLDILKWSIENPSSNVMILAKNFKEEAAVKISYLDISHNLFLAYDLRTESPEWLCSFSMRPRSAHLMKSSFMPTKTKIEFDSFLSLFRKFDTSFRFFPKAIQTSHKGRRTQVFWDVSDSSKLEVLDPRGVAAHISGALVGNGYSLPLCSTLVFIDENTVSPDTLSRYAHANLLLHPVPKGNKFARMHSIALDLLFHARTCSEPSTLLLLSEDIDEDPLFSTVLDFLQMKGFNIVVQNPNPIVELPFNPNYYVFDDISPKF